MLRAQSALFGKGELVDRIQSLMTKLSKYLWMVKIESYLLDISIYYPFQVNIHNLKVHKVKICFNHVIFIKQALKWPENSANLLVTLAYKSIKSPLKITVYFPPL